MSLSSTSQPRKQYKFQTVNTHSDDFSTNYKLKIAVLSLPTSMPTGSFLDICPKQRRHSLSLGIFLCYDWTQTLEVIQVGKINISKLTFEPQ